MNILLWIIFGGLVGWIASMIMKTDEEQGVVLNIVIGIIGAVLGGWIMSVFGRLGITGFNLRTFLVALGGSIALIAVVQMLQSLHRSHSHDPGMK